MRGLFSPPRKHHSPPPAGDSTAPTVPTGLAVSALSTSALHTSWNASTDSGGSGLAGYKLERSSDGLTGWAQVYQGTSPTFDNSGLSSATTYFYRVRSYDNAGNNSGYSSVVSGTTSSASGFADPMADWLARSTATATNRVTFASDFSGAADFTLASVNGGTGRVFALGMNPTELAQVTKDTTDGLTNGCCLKILKPASEGTGSCEWMFPLNSTWTANNQSFGLGVPFWIQFRFKIPPSRLVKSILNPSGSLQYAWKWMNIAQYSPTNTSSKSFANSYAQIVLQDTDQLGVPQAYHRDPAGSFPAFLGGGTESSPAGIFKTVQNSIDRGAGVANHANRYCEVPGPNFDTASPGCEFWPTDEWMTFLLRILPASYTGAAGNQFDMWYARAGATTWTHLIHEVDFQLGDPNSNGPDGFTGLNGGHFLTYESQRSSSTVDTYHKYDQVIVSLDEIPIPLDSGVPSNSPAWYQSLTSGQWGQIPDTRLQNCPAFEKGKVPPFTSGGFGNDGSWNCITAYGGGVQGTGFIYGGATKYDGPFFLQKGGGHQIGAQAPYFIPFLYDTPSGTNKWKKYRASVVDGSGEYIAATPGLAFDGSGNPVANQTYDSLSYIPSDNVILQMGMTFCHTSDASYLNVGKSLKINCNQISPDSNNPYSTVADPPFGTGCGASAWEAPNGSNGAKGTIWFQGQGDGKFSSYNVATNTYGTVYSLSYAAASQPTMACDQNRGILCIVGQVEINASGVYGFGIGMLRTSNPSGDWYGYVNHNGAAPLGMMVQDINGVPDAGTPTPGDSTGNDATILWNPDLDCFVVWYGGKTLWKLVPPAANPYKFGDRWTWTPLTSASGNDPSPTDIQGSTGFNNLAQGTYQRFGYISDSRCRGYFLLHGVNENMYFWKV